MTRPDPRDIARYLDGRSTPQEARSIEAWLDASEEHRRVFDQQRTLWELAGNVDRDRTGFESSAVQSWAQLQAAIRQSDSGIGAAEFETDGMAAADTPEYGEAAVRRPLEALERAPMRRQDRAAAARRTGSRRPRKRLAAFAAALAVLTASAWWLTQALDRHASPALSAFREVETQPGQRARIPLDDGTFVRLNVASKIRFPEAFNGGSREVYLEGEAFFEVSEDSTRPFIVHASEASVRVLGTAFNIRAYHEDPGVDVVVARGKVALADSAATESDAVVLTAGQMGRVEQGRQERVSDRVDVTRHVAWMEGRLIFEDAPLRDVAVELKRWYMLDVRIADPALADWRLTASFKNESIDEMLSVIAASLNVNYSRDREEVTFYP